MNEECIWPTNRPIIREGIHKNAYSSKCMYLQARTNVEQTTKKHDYIQPYHHHYTYTHFVMTKFTKYCRLSVYYNTIAMNSQ